MNEDYTIFDLKEKERGRQKLLRSLVAVWPWNLSSSSYLDDGEVGPACLLKESVKRLGGRPRRQAQFWVGVPEVIECVLADEGGGTSQPC